MKDRISEWSLSYYLGALKGMEKEIKDMDEAMSRLGEIARSLQGRFAQFSFFFKYLATGPWQSMETAPLNGTPLLLRFSSGLCQVCKWASWPTEDGSMDGGWVIGGDEVVVMMEEPLAWAEIIEEGNHCPWEEQCLKTKANS